MEKTCSDCGKMFRVPAELARHKAKQRPCTQTTTPHHHCQRCGRTFTQKSHVRRHEQTACGGSEPSVAALRRQVEQQRLQIAALEARIPVTLNVSVVHTFGSESISHLGRGTVYRRVFQPVTACDPQVSDAGLKKLSHDAITHAAMLIFGDEEHSDNITCYIPRKGAENAYIRSGTGWALVPLRLVVPPMFRRSVDLLFSHQPLDGVDGCPTIGEDRSAIERLLTYISKKEGELSEQDDQTMRPVLLSNAATLRRLTPTLADLLNGCEPQAALP